MVRGVPLVAVVLVSGALWGCGAERASSPTDPAAGATPEWFVDGAQASGLDFVHFNGMTGAFYQPEIMGPGVALFDYDNDGDLDVFIVQGQMLAPGKIIADAKIKPAGPLPLKGR